MALGEITRKIAADAEAEAAQIIAKAEAEAESLRSEAQAKAERRAGEIGHEGDVRAARAREAVLSAAHLESKAEILKAKQALVGKVLDAAAGAAAEVPADRFREALKGLIAADHFAGPQKLLVREADREKLTTEFLAELGSALGDSAKIEAVETTDEISSGYILLQGKRRINADFARTVSFNRGEYEMLAARTLFGDGGDS
jgi:V/A-type H+-transporting ATPase subunit E